MPRISGKRAFLELLKQEGVEVLFGNPGTTELPLMDAFAVDRDIRYVLALQEAAAMAMADGYAQASGKLAVVNLHVAPGLGNAMGMLYDAQKSAAPVLVTAGQHDQGFNVTEPILWADLPTLARPLVKWSAEVHRLADLPRMIHRAAKTALAPPTGPVFLSLPADVLNAEEEIDLGAPTRVAPEIRGDRAAIEAAATLLAGPSARSSWPATPWRRAARMPSSSRLRSSSARRSIPRASPTPPRFRPRIRCSAAPWCGSRRRSARSSTEHDVLFSVGGDLFTLSLPSDVDPVPEGLTIIHLDTDPWELGKNYPAEVAILGSPKATLPELTGARARAHVERRAGTRRASGSKPPAAATLPSARRSPSEAGRTHGRTPMQPLALHAAIGAMLPRDAVVVEEALSSGGGMRQLIRSDDPQSFFGLRGGGIGWGLPAAIGVKLALPDRPVVALIGDGSAMYTCQALWTAAHHEHRRRLRDPQQHAPTASSSSACTRMRGHAAQTDLYVGMELTDPPIDFVALARSMGVAAERAATVAEATDLLATAVAGEAPMLIEVELDRAFKPM